jgi:predicted aspartyl protease
MIRGFVNFRNEAVVPIRVRGPGGIEATAEAVVDTGFTAALILPSAVIAVEIAARP